MNEFDKNTENTVDKEWGEPQAQPTAPVEAGSAAPVGQSAPAQSADAAPEQPQAESVQPQAQPAPSAPEAPSVQVPPAAPAAPVVGQQPVQPNPYAAPVPPAPNYAVQQPQYNRPPQPQQPYYGAVPPQQAYYGAPQAPQKNTRAHGLAIASMVVGIASIVLCYCYGIGLIGGIVGLILGIVARSRGNNEGFSLAGIILNAFGIVMGVVGLLVLVAMFSEIANGTYDDFYRQLQDQLGRDANGFAALIGKIFK